MSLHQEETVYRLSELLQGPLYVYWPSYFDEQQSLSMDCHVGHP